MGALPRPDVVVIGGGPAGLCAAIALRLIGASVVVLDAAAPPIDKACGEGLLPGTVDALAKLGVSLDPTESFLLHGIRFLCGPNQVTATFQGRKAFGVRRTVLHQLLVNRATELQVDLRWQSKKIALCSSSVSSQDFRAQPGIVVGADGQQSYVRRAAGLDKSIHTSQRFGFRRHYQLQPWTNVVEVYWHKKCQIYVTPVSSDQVGVAMLSQSSHWRLADALSLFPSLLERLSASRGMSTERGGLSRATILRHVQAGNVVLLGDASGSVDAITGDGIGLAARQALILADALRGGRLEEYEKHHRGVCRRAVFMERLLLSLDAHPWFQLPVVKSLAKVPSLFQRLVDFHVGSDRTNPLDTADRHAYDVAHF
jgi:menaquinone-9 beta-reductase